MITTRISRIICFMFLLIFSASACSAAKDEAMPLTQNNIDKFIKQVNGAAKDIDPASGTDVERLSKIYKLSMDKLGFSLDKTIRNMFLNLNQITGSRSTNQFAQIMWPAYTTVIEKTEASVQAGLITQKTGDLIIMGKKAGEPISDEVFKYISVAMDCQKENNNVCAMPKFIELLARRGLLPQELLKEKVDLIDLRAMTTPLADQGKFREWGTQEWILQSDGKPITRSVQPTSSDLTFIVNVQKVEATRQFSKLLEEERRGMSRKQ